MARKGTTGTRQLVVDITEGLRGRLDERVKLEQRTLRTVVERAIAYYLDHVPADSTPPAPAPDQPRRGPRARGK